MKKAGAKANVLYDVLGILNTHNPECASKKLDEMFQMYCNKERHFRTLLGIKNPDELNDIYRLRYSYSFFQDDRMDLALSIGTYVMPIEIGLNATGLVNVDETEDISIPPMLAQPFIENAIIHGLVPSKEKGFLKIEFEERNNVLNILID